MYFTELLRNWRYLLSAALGLALGHTLTLYTTSLFSPHLIAEFGWTKAQFALVGMTTAIGIIGLPVAGRLTDLFGVRRVAAVGVACSPLAFVALSLSGPEFSWFFAVTLFQATVIGTTTTSVVYSRLVAQGFERARGVALSVTACAPAAAVALAAWLLGGFIDTHGWRAGYLSLAAATAFGGTAVLLLIPRMQAQSKREVTQPRLGTRQAVTVVLRSSAFRIIVASAFLCNLSQTAVASQLKLILLDRGVDSDQATALLSLFAVSIIAGRLLAGIALDRLPSHLIAAFTLGMPCVGLPILAAGGGFLPLAAAVIILGFASGSELDVLAYLIMRFFGLETYSTTFGLVAAVIATSAGLGSAFLGLSLAVTGDFQLFLLTAGGAALLGGGLFVLLGRQPAWEAPIRDAAIDITDEGARIKLIPIEE